MSGREELPQVQARGGGREELPQVQAQGGGQEELPHVQCKEWRLHFAGAAVKRYPTSKVRETQFRQIKQFRLRNPI